MTNAVQKRLVTVALVNVDSSSAARWSSPAWQSSPPVLEDLVRLILGQDSSFLKHARFAGPQGRPQR